MNWWIMDTWILCSSGKRQGNTTIRILIIYQEVMTIDNLMIFMIYYIGWYKRNRQYIYDPIDQQNIQLKDFSVFVMWKNTKLVCPAPRIHRHFQWVVFCRYFWFSCPPPPPPPLAKKLAIRCWQVHNLTLFCFHDFPLSVHAYSYFESHWA